MIIYGWGKDLKQVAYAGIDKCPNCKNYGHFWLCEHSSHASLYFIKVVRWNKKLLYMCQTCERGWEIDEKAGNEAIERTIRLPSPEQCVTMWTRLDTAVSRAVDYPIAVGGQSAITPLSAAIGKTIEELKTEYQHDHVGYIANRYIAFLQDPDKAA
jgi:hypothetical protein